MSQNVCYGLISVSDDLGTDSKPFEQIIYKVTIIVAKYINREAPKVLKVVCIVDYKTQAI